MTATEKPCSRCKEILPLSDFYPRRRMLLGRQSHCKRCARKWHHERPEYIRRKNAEFKRKNPNYAINWGRKRRFGLLPGQIEQMRLTQEDKCIGCLRSFSEAGMKMCVDHCHQTKRVRGLLCNECNLAIGYVQDDSGTLSRLGNYLSRIEAENY